MFETTTGAGKGADSDDPLTLLNINGAEATSRALKFNAPACNWKALAPCLGISYSERGCKKRNLASLILGKPPYSLLNLTDHETNDPTLL